MQNMHRQHSRRFRITPIMNTKVCYKVKNLIGNWESSPHSTIEEAQSNLVRLRDRVNMQEWKSAPASNYVIIKEETIVNHTIISYQNSPVVIQGLEELVN